MRSESSYLRRFTQPYRHAWEILSFFGWTAAAAYIGSLWVLNRLPQSFTAFAVALCLTIALYRLYEGWRIWRSRSFLHGYKTAYMSHQELARKTRKDELWLGTGFLWEPAHSQKLHELSRDGFHRWRLNPWALACSLRKGEVQPDTDQGLAAIHGLNEGEYDLYRPLKNFEGGTGLIGTTQAGKGVLLNVLISQAIYRGDVVIIIDPKGSERLWNSIESACRIAKRPKPYLFTTDTHGRGVRLNPFHTWNSPGEIATRVVSVMSPNSDEAFRSFAWSAVDTVVQALVELNIKPSIRLVEHHINIGITELLSQLLKQHAQKVGDRGWRKQAEDLTPRKQGMGDKEYDLLVRINWYERILSKDQLSRTIESALKVHHHSREHYDKITASLMPVFALLNNGDLQRILSPNPNDAHDRRPILSLEEIIRNKGVLYMSMGSLQNADVASAVGAIFLADLAAIAGKRYQLRQNDIRISIFVDEVSNVLNIPLIEILNKGAEGGMYTTCAMQTMADLEERMKSKAAARKVIGNLNNVIALRTKDGETRDVFTETMGKTYISQVDTAINTHAENFSGIPAYNAGATHKRTSRREDIVPGEFFSMLPNCQYFAMVSAGLFFKGRAPILFDEDKQPIKAPEHSEEPLTRASDEELQAVLNSAVLREAAANDSDSAEKAS